MVRKIIARAFGFGGPTKGWKRHMDANDCKRERFSNRTIGIIILLVSMLLLVIGLVILPVVGFIFATPLIILGIAMVAAPESNACQLIRKKLRVA
jgi:hypothetical protein